MEQRNLTSELRSVACESYPQIFERFRQLSERYGDMPAGALAEELARDGVA